MKIAVLGLWHLGCVTAACCAKHFNVVGIEFEPLRLQRLRDGCSPVFEPGLDELLHEGFRSGRLEVTDSPIAACADVEVLWVTHDTPVDENDQPDIEPVLSDVRRCIPALPPGALVLLSSQLPVGTCRLLETEFSSCGYRFACSPENLRLGKAIEIFTNPDRIVIGCREDLTRIELARLFSPFTNKIVWMRPESAEMTKHAINGFLAASISFMNEVACLCEDTGADAKEVEQGLKSESRIGPRAYLMPGGAFAGGTLARDVVTLTKIGLDHGEPLELLPAIKRSNDRHRLWTLRTIKKRFAGEADRRITLLGLTYKPGTDTLRRSSAVELARELAASGFEVRAFDPSQVRLPPGLGFIQLKANATDAILGADAIVICTEWPEFRALDWPGLLRQVRHALVIDATRFLENSVAKIPNVHHVAVGSPA